MHPLKLVSLQGSNFSIAESHFLHPPFLQAFSPLSNPLPNPARKALIFNILIFNL